MRGPGPRGAATAVRRWSAMLVPATCEPLADVAGHADGAGEGTWQACCGGVEIFSSCAWSVPR